ncbi:hypothetical protein [Herbaspirillum sp. CAH-3]|uniref:hypothetical protein n=1 Tax=Herbaspirillum sp. CAH-3 TaxID=2605746 RepID=UPI001E4F32EA|nr:hypothetical protein [Herbaspirillum sp. CAH-3]
MKNMLGNIRESVMRTISQGNKFLVLLLVLPWSSFAGELPKISEKILSQYREQSKKGNPPGKYVLVHADGSEAKTGSSARPVYLLNISADPVSKLISSPEIDKLIKGEFSLELQSDILLSQGQTDYIVLAMSRPAQNNPRYVPCMIGAGEDRAYLLAISAGMLKVVNRFFGGCATSYELIQEGADLGYRVIEEGQTRRTVRYMLRGDNVVREPDYYKTGGSK